MDWENHLEEKSYPKNGKNSKTESEIAACEQQKPLARKRIFVQIPFSHSTLKLAQKIHAVKTTCFFAPPPVSA